jgi:HSP20 family protein
MPDRNNPFEELERLLERMTRQFDQLDERPGRTRPTADDEPPAARTSLDVADHGDAFVVTVDVPGFDKEDVSVQLREDALTISAEVVDSDETEREDEDVTYLRRERSRRSVRRTVTLPSAVDADETTATYRNGVLRVRLLKVESDEGPGESIDIE